jgi:hypothetical protein
MNSSEEMNKDKAEVPTGDHGHAVLSDEKYERAAASAVATMRRGFHMGGGPKVSREELHDRKA